MHKRFTDEEKRATCAIVLNGGSSDALSFWGAVDALSRWLQYWAYHEREKAKGLAWSEEHTIDFTCEFLQRHMSSYDFLSKHIPCPIPVFSVWRTFGSLCGALVRYIDFLGTRLTDAQKKKPRGRFEKHIPTVFDIAREEWETYLDDSIDTMVKHADDPRDPLYDPNRVAINHYMRVARKFRPASVPYQEYAEEGE